MVWAIHARRGGEEIVCLEDDGRSCRLEVAVVDDVAIRGRYGDLFEIEAEIATASTNASEFGTVAVESGIATATDFENKIESLGSEVEVAEAEVAPEAVLAPDVDYELRDRHRRLLLLLVREMTCQASSPGLSHLHFLHQYS